MVDFLACNLVESKKYCFINWLNIFNSNRPWAEVDFNLKSDETLSPLYYMSYSGVTGVLKTILKKGANINAKGGEYGTALVAASRNNHEEVVQLLLKNGAKVNAESRDYGNAMSIALYEGHKGMVRLFQDKEADINANIDLVT